MGERPEHPVRLRASDGSPVPARTASILVADEHGEACMAIFRATASIGVDS
jgi:hypothetical protein